ncbi:phosphopantetheine-binding protein, partial [Paeniglutamicibacter kerguelensis]
MSARRQKAESATEPTAPHTAETPAAPAGNGSPATPATGATAQVQVQGRLAEVLAGVLGIDHVPVDSDFFQDLGADSLVMAQFCARVRKQPDLPAVS